MIKEITTEKNNPDNHEHLFQISQSDIGLEAYIAIHNTSFGPAVGGTRMYPYISKEEAVTDALRLSKAMTYKCVMANVNFGGGKGVIIGDPRKKSKSLLRGYAEAIQELGGAFYTGEDVGISEGDVQYMLEFSKFFIGKKDKAGDPSPYAALSTFYSMRAASKSLFGPPAIQNRSVVVKGVGKVGGGLVRLLISDGAIVTISDINNEAIRAIRSFAPTINAVEPLMAHRIECDIFAPCALGNEINKTTIPELKAKIVCGAANNQLATQEDGDGLFNKNILYIPDFIANSGGLINVVEELNPSGYSNFRVEEKIKAIENTVSELIQLSKTQKKSLNSIANLKVEKILKEGKRS